MNKTKISFSVTLSVISLAMLSPLQAYANFLGDSKASLQLRNFYFNNDFRQEGVAQSKRDEWAQGFILKYESGYTTGPVGFGLDAVGLLGLKLDSGPERQNTGLLPVGSDKAPDDYSQLGLAGKVRISNSELRFGTLIPRLPTVLPSDSRLLPQSFQGTHLTVQELEGLTAKAGRLTQNSLRNSSSSDDMSVTGSGITGAMPTDRFDFAGVNYKWTSGLSTEYNYGKLVHNYKQHIVNLLHTLQTGENGSLVSDLRYAHSGSDGYSNIDNKSFGVMFTYRLHSHKYAVAYQEMRGDTGYPRINGTDPFLVNFVMLAPDFANPGENSWQVRYDYDFAAMGIPGLSFMTRYLQGDDFERGGRSAKEWERNTDISYVVQSGPLKSVGFRWRNGSYRSSGGNDIDQNRFIVSYTIPLL